MSNSLQPYAAQSFTKLPCPSPFPRVYLNSCPLSRWCHPTISSSVVSVYSCPQSFPASGSFQMSQLFASGGRSIGVSVSASVLPMNIQSWFPLGLTGLISILSKELSRVFSNTTVQKHQLKHQFKHHSWKASMSFICSCKMWPPHPEVGDRCAPELGTWCLFKWSKTGPLFSPRHFKDKASGKSWVLLK